LYSRMHFITAASLITFGGLIGVGAPILLLSNVDRPLLAKADIADSLANPCKHTWLQFDRACLSKRDLPSTAERTVPNGGTTEVKPEAEPNPAPEQPSTDSRHAAAAPQEPVPQERAPKEILSGSPMSPAPTSWEPRKSMPPDFVLQGLAPQESAPPKPASQETGPAAQESTVHPSTLPRKRAARTTPTLPSAAVEQRVAKSATETQASQPTAKKPIRGSRIAKRSTNEALSIVRRFGDSPRDIPGNAYAGNGTRAGSRPGMPLDIRPTSIQDVYYYSVPR
jgi:hypothetical protein